MIRSVLGVGTDPEECSWKEWSGLAGWLKLLSGMMTMMLYPDVKVVVWAISEKGQKCHNQTLRENKQGKIFAKENATGREGETEMIFSVFGGSLISFVMWNPSFNLPLSLSPIKILKTRISHKFWGKSQLAIGISTKYEEKFNFSGPIKRGTCTRQLSQNYS